MDKRYLSESSILKEIKYYIDTDFYNYAVMIEIKTCYLIQFNVA